MATTFSPTLVILNPLAGSGQADRIWSNLEAQVRDQLGEIKLITTQHPLEVPAQLAHAAQAGIQRVISLGGDGTNHVMLNALQNFAAKNPELPPFIYGQIPLGTGRDFCRTLGTPFDPKKAVQWLSTAQPQKIDIGQLEIDGQDTHYFLNIASAGISGEVAHRVNRIEQRHFWSFHMASLQTIFTYQPRHLKVTLDGETWYDDKSWIVAVANGQMFGHGMHVAPQASIIDGLFDVIMIENSPRLSLTWALNSIYSGKHVNRPDVHVKRAREVIIECADDVLGFEMDGETHSGHTLKFTVLPQALAMLAHEVN